MAKGFNEEEEKRNLTSNEHLVGLFEINMASLVNKYTLTNKVEESGQPRKQSTMESADMFWQPLLKKDTQALEADTSKDPLRE